MIRRRLAAQAALALAAAALWACAHGSPGSTPPAAPGSAPAGAVRPDPALARAGELPGESALDARPAIPPLPPFDAPLPRQLSLATGLRVLVLQRPGAPLETVQLVHGRGAASDPSDLPGTASLLAAMLEAGSAGKTQEEVAQAADALGASLHALASEDALSVGISGLAARAPEMIALLADVALRPDFDGAEWERVKAQRLAGLRAQRAEPQAAARLAFAAAVYGPHPLARPVPGTPESVARLQLDDVKRFFSTLSPSEAALVVSGGLPAEQVMPLLEAAFGGFRGPARVRAVRPGAQAVLPPQTAPQTAPPPPASARPRLVMVDFPGKPQSVIVVGQPSVPRSSPEVMALRLLNAALGGSFTSRLNQNLREQHGYSYGAGSSFAFGRGPGPFSAGASVKTEVTGEALREMLGEIRRTLAEPLQRAELDKAKALLAFDLVGTLEHSDAAAGAAANMFLYGLPLDELRTFVPRLRALDEGQVEASARRAIDPAALTVVIAGDMAKVLPQLAAAGLSLGKPEVRDADGLLVPRPR